MAPPESHRSTPLPHPADPGGHWLEAALDTARLGAWEWHRESGASRWSTGMYEILGYRPGEVEPSIAAWRARVHPEDVAALDAGAADPAGPDWEDRREYRLLLPDGSVRWVERRGRPVDDGRRILGTLADVTQRRRRQAQLDDLSTRMGAALGAAEIGTWVWDVANDVLSTDANLAAIFGVAPDEATGTPVATFLERVHPLDRADLEREIAEALEAKDRFAAEYRVLDSAGRQRRVLARGVVERDPNGRPARLPGVVVDVTAQRAAEQALLESEERFRATFEQAAVGIANVGLDGSWLRVNDRLCEIVGYAREELLARTFQDITHPDDLDRDLALTDRLLNGDIPRYEMEKRYLHRDGHVVWVHLTGAVHRDHRGAPLFAIAVVQDISERKRAEQRTAAEHAAAQILAESASLEQAAPRLMSELCRRLELARTELWLPDPGGERLTCAVAAGAADDPGWSDVTARLRLARGEGLPGEVWQSARAAWLERLDDPARFARAACAEAAGLRAAVGFPILLGRACEGVVLGFMREPVPVDEHLVAALTAIGREIGQFLRRTRAEAALRVSEERYRLAVQATSEAVWDWDLETDEILRSDAISDQFGFSREAVRTDPAWWRAHVHPDDLARVVASFAPLLAGETAHWQAEYRFRRGDGGWAHVVDRAAAQLDSSGRPVRVIGAMLDLTERYRIEQRLREEDRRKDEFLAMLGHELRNPLAAISSALQVAESGPTAERRQWAEEVLRRQVVQLDRLVADLLDVARVRQGRLALRPTGAHLAPLVRSAVSAVERQVADRGQNLRVQLPDEDIAITADAARLEQVLVNLLSNAAKYTEPGGSIALAAGERDGSLEITVRDTGIGLGEDEHQRVFEMFAQAPGSAERGTGLGLGLSLVKAIVEGHGGTVTASSPGPGLGSTFTVRLPVLADGPVEIAATPGADAPGREAGPSRAVLVVDDNRDLARSLAAALEHAGHRVLLAYDGAAGLELATRERPDAVLLDLGLPDTTGADVARRLRAAGSTAFILGITGYGRSADRERALSAGMDDLMVKPIDHRVLLGRLGAVAAAEDADAAGAALTFVVIDDSRAVADLTAELLAERGHRVEVAYEGRSGIEAARRLRPDAVLCDLNLPGMNGRQVAEQLSGAGAGLLLAVTAHAPDDAERMIAGSAFHCALSKPIDLDDVERRTRAARAARPDTSRPS